MATGEIIGEVAEQVADELELAAIATRRLDAKMLGSITLGIGIGVAVGFYFGYRYSKKKLSAQIYAEAEAEFTELSDHYRQKIAAVSAQDKPSVESIMKEKGYTEIIEGNTTGGATVYTSPGGEGVRPLPAPVPIHDPRPPIELVVPAVRNDGEWNYDEELANRSDDTPCILHVDEYEGKEGNLEQSALIYYAVDGILVDEDDQTDVLTNVGELIGDALDYFGHGSGDPDIVYVRNPVIEHEFEVTRVQSSWEHDVMGLDPDDNTA